MSSPPDIRVKGGIISVTVYFLKLGSNEFSNGRKKPNQIYLY
jgi:hypothetical protein